MGKLITREELDVILERHKKWLKGQKGGRKANLKGAILRELRLTNICLSWADLTGADLSGADLTNANLVGADLTNASLVGADLTVVDLSYANLDKTDLSYADLTDVDFEHSNLEPAILSSSEEIRRGIYLKKPMTGYKKCPGDIIVTLEIPEHAIVFSINNSKCRTNVAKVIDIDNGLRHLEQAVSQYDRNFIYRKGEMVYTDEFDCRYNVECGGGIHFFRTREEAEEYF